MSNILYSGKQLEPEYRFSYPYGNSGQIAFFISGVVHCSPGDLKGDKDDSLTATHDVKIRVGPWFDAIDSATPTVTITGFTNTNSDSDDQQLWSLVGVHHKVVKEETGIGIGRRYRLELNLRIYVKGKYSQVTKLSYSVAGIGQLPDSNFLGIQFPDMLQVPNPMQPWQQGVQLAGREPGLPRAKDMYMHRIPGNDLFVLSGVYDTGNLQSSDDALVSNTLRFTCGPDWKNISAATVYLNTLKFENRNPDTDEALGWELIRPSWQALPVSANEFRMKITHDLNQQGDSSLYGRLGYMIFGMAGMPDKHNQPVPKAIQNAINIKEVVLDDIRDGNYNFIKAGREPERRLLLLLNSPVADHHTLISGNIHLNPHELLGDALPDDGFRLNLFIPVGPYWKKINSAVPQVFITGVECTDPDEDDVMLYEMQLKKQLVITDVGIGHVEKQLCLHLVLETREYSTGIIKLGYAASIVGQLGEKGINNP